MSQKDYYDLWQRLKKTAKIELPSEPGWFTVYIGKILADFFKTTESFHLSELIGYVKTRIQHDRYNLAIPAYVLAEHIEFYGVVTREPISRDMEVVSILLSLSEK